MVGTHLVLTQVGISKKGVSFVNPLTVTIMLRPSTEEVINKVITPITSPKSTAAQEPDTTDTDNYGPNKTKIVDMLMKVEQKVIIDGYLISGTISGDSSTTATGRKADLKKIILGGGVFNVQNDGATYTANCTQISIRDNPGRGEIATGDTDVAEYDVKFTLLKGIDF